MRKIIVTLVAALVVSVSAPAQGLDDALQKIANFKFGEDREPESVVNDLVRKADNAGGEQRKAAEQSLLTLLKTNPSPDCVDFLCRQLMIVGSEASVPVLAPMLTKDEKSADWARYAMERIDSDAVDKALIKAAPRTSGRARIGIINSLGNRKSESAVKILARFTKEKDTGVSSAAIVALGQIGGDNAADAIAKVRKGDSKAVADDAYLACARQYLADGKNDKATKILDTLNDPSEPARVRGAVVTTLASVDPAKTRGSLIELLKGDDEYLRAVAVGLLRNSGESGATAAVAQALPSLKPGAQVLALGILEHRDDRSTLAAVKGVASSSDPAVKLAALHALGVLGDGSVVPTLLASATGGDEETKRIANDGLDALRGSGIDEVMLGALNGANVDTRAVLIRSLAARGAKSALPALYAATGDADEGIRAKACDALGKLAGPDELPNLIALLAKLNGNSAQPQVESAVVTVSQKVPDSNARAKAVLDALAASKDVNVRTSLTTVAGRLGDSGALPTLRALADQKREKSVQEAAVRALCEWPTAETLGDLRAMAAKSKSDTFRALAFNGMIRVARMERGPDVDTQLKVYEEALGLAKTPDDKRLVLAGLGGVADARALALAKKLEADESVKAEAKQAIEQISKSIEKK